MDCRRQDVGLDGQGVLVGTVPDVLNIYNVLTTLGHRFGHQSGLDESSRRTSTIFCMELRFVSV